MKKPDEKEEKEPELKRPSPKNLKKWAKQFSEGEWSQLCESEEFLAIVLDSIEMSSTVAAEILKKEVKSC